MTAMTQDLAAQLQGAPLQQIASQLGLDPVQASGAISTALPLLMGKLGSNAASPVTAAAMCGTIPSVQPNAATMLARAPRERPAAIV